jgi:hypothetical protein
MVVVSKNGHHSYFKQTMRYFIILIFFEFIPICIVCQTAPVQLWEASEFVENIQIKGSTIQLDKFQNTYMLTTQLDVNPFTGFTLVKYDTVGNALWNVNYLPGIIGHYYGSFTLDSLGYSYVSICFDGGLPSYDADAILMKYSPEGETIWERNYGLNQAGDSYIYYSEMDSLGRLIVLGMNLSDEEEADNFLFISCLDVATGDTLWRTTIPGIYYPQNLKICSDRIEALVTQYLPDSKYYGIVQMDFNGLILQHRSKPYSGYEIDFNTISKTGDVLLGNRAFGYDVTKLSTQGDTLWRYHFADALGTSKNWVRKVVEDDSMFIYSTGTAHVYDKYGEFITTKFTSEGQVVWNNIYHLTTDSLFDTGNFVAVDDHFVYAIGGGQVSGSLSSLLLLIYDKYTGIKVYDLAFEKKSMNGGYEVIPKGNKIYFTGYSHQGNATSTEIITRCIQLPKITSTVDVNNLTSNINIFPNPTADWVQITDIDTQVFKRIIIYDAGGKIIKSLDVHESALNFSLSTIPAGIYVITLEGDGVRLNKKLVKQ